METLFVKTHCKISWKNICWYQLNKKLILHTCNMHCYTKSVPMVTYTCVSLYTIGTDGGEGGGGGGVSFVFYGLFTTFS